MSHNLQKPHIFGHMCRLPGAFGAHVLLYKQTWQSLWRYIGVAN